MMIRRTIRRFFARSFVDFEAGDFVRRVGYRGIGIVESVSDSHAVVAWSKDERDILPLICLRRADPGGHLLDRKD